MSDALLQDLWFHQTDGIAIDSIDTDDESVVIRARAQGLTAACPSCGVLSGRVHSRYVRRLADSPVGGRPVVIVLGVRRFRCRERGCSRATFAEQLDGLTFRYGRRSSGLQSVLRHVALMLAGRAGARLVETLASVVSRSTLLRLVRALPDPESATPRVLGVDEFALRKGHVYGTILVDIETRRPVDLLPDRSVATVAQWLTDHPGVEVICRDRSVAYAEAGRLGAPDAIHVADRWHIWKNLAEAVEKTVIQHRALLRNPQEETPARPVMPADFAEPAPSAAPAGPRLTGRLSDRVRRQHAAVHGLLTQGKGLRAIARELGLARNTVRRLAHVGSPDELLVGQWTGRTSIYDPHKTYLHQRWNEGCTNGAQLFAELRERGYQGGSTIVRQYARRFREAFPHDDVPRKPPSVRDVTSWITRHPDSLDADQAQQLKDVLARCPALDRTAEHVRAFADLMNNRNGHQLHHWIAKAQADDLPALHTLTAGLAQDLDAVVAGLSMSYSSGPVEGHNNKIKMLKRQMFGRASFDLLRKRVLLAARGRS
ncbi:ISL3 family transposase [Streptomyces cinnamoneus]|uniref:ISL3 family transposase n=1 Tax=Streptomyces cinnamoneus TaxID=53446 RepID=A0A918U0I5_STRCJ|nr:ISL3 family transposase [Streptomyces cinnamoneus]GHC72934.1 ISL3 family transposase [Streptomyces cinnamoneus]